MVSRKPFSKAEMKTLVYKKVQSGMSYEDACKQVGKEVDQVIKNDNNLKKEKKSKKKKDLNKTFKEGFKKLTNGKE